MKFDRNKLEKICSAAAFAILCAIVLYAGFFGVGNPISIGGLSAWAILLLAFLLSAGFPLLRNLKNVLKNPYLWMLAAFGGWVAFSAVHGIVKGNSPRMVIRDISGVIYFAFFPFILAVLKDKKRIHTAMKCMMYANFAMSVFFTAAFVMFLFQPDRFEPIQDGLVKIGFLNYSRISPTIPRLLFVSLPFQIFGCAFAIYFQVIDHKVKPFYACITGLCLYVLVMTFTRALYLSEIVVALGLVIMLLFTLKKENQKIIWGSLGAAAAVCILMITVLSVIGKTNYFDFAIRRGIVGLDASVIQTTEPGTEATEAVDPSKPTIDQEKENYLQATIASDNLRLMIKNELLDVIHKSPIIGSGMGIALENKKDWPEYSYLDLMAKTGIIGLLLYFLPIILMAVTLMKDIAKGKQRLLSATWFVAMIGLLSYSVFQPFLNNVQCVLIYCCAICVHSVQTAD